jgi:glyoxylase-like metal-dependent hydrolase (beta-lactamase superfamily II)
MEQMVGAGQPSLQEIADGVHAWIGANGDSNAGAVETIDGVVVVDAQQNLRLAKRFRAALQTSVSRPITCLVNTHFHLDHTAGNVAFADVPIVANAHTGAIMESYLGASDSGEWTVSDVGLKLRLFFGSNIQDLVVPGCPEESWFVNRMSGPDYDTIVLRGPTEAFADSFSFGRAHGEMRLAYWGPAHCDGDVIVWLERAKVVFLGDLMFHGRFPWLGDCDLDGWIGHLGRVLSLDVDKVVPGHGSLATLKDVAEFRSLLMALRDGTANAIKAGASEDAAVEMVSLPQYAAMPRYREWMPFNVRSAYRYLKSRQ